MTPRQYNAQRINQALNDLRATTPPKRFVKRIYLAGKIGQDDWRTNVVSGLESLSIPTPFGSRCGGEIETPGVKDWPILPKAILGKYDYVGPYFSQCTHTCTPLDNDHGLAAVADGEEGEDTVKRQRWVHTQCIAAINKADTIFAVLDGLTAYGTLVELGYAAAKGKTIFIASTNPLRYNLWFVQKFSAQTVCADTTDKIGHMAKDALELVINEYLGIGVSPSAGTPWYENASPIERAFWDALIKTDPSLADTVKREYTVLNGKYRVDFTHPDTMTAIELDGLRGHSTPADIEKDRKRQREIEALGWRFIRFGGSEITRNATACATEAVTFIKQQPVRV